MSKRCPRSFSVVPVSGDDLITRRVRCPGCGRLVAIKETTAIGGQRQARLSRHHAPDERDTVTEVAIVVDESGNYDATAVAEKLRRELMAAKLRAPEGSPWELVESISVRVGDGLRIVPRELVSEVRRIESVIVLGASIRR